MNQQIAAPILTTREAVAIALGETAAQCRAFDHGCVRCQAVRLLCDLYGFKLDQFFGEPQEAYFESESSKAMPLIPIIENPVINNPEGWVK